MEQKTNKYILKDILITLLILSSTCVLCGLLSISGRTNGFPSMLFILAVLLVARFTHGYIYGIIAAVISVLAVNLFFVYPYFQFNFTLTGYPVTMLCMLAVSFITSTLTTQTKQSERIKAAAAQEQMRGNLLRAVSHDLRTPLTSILGATSVIIDNDESLTHQERVNLMQSAHDDAQWLIRMVENLLAVTKIDNESNAKIIKTQQAAEEIVSETVVKFKKIYPSAPLSVKVPDELLMIPMDAVLIEQVLINLLENSVIHGNNPDSIELSVTRNNDRAIFEVRDNGEGIDSSLLPNIFESRISSDNYLSVNGKKNMGIGLSVCNTIIKAHGGEMYAFNSNSGGAVFRFYLTLSEEKENGQ